MFKSFKYRLYPTPAQVEKLEQTIERCRELYNAALSERRDAWKTCHVGLNFATQSAQLPEIKKGRPEFKDVHSQVLQDVLHRVDKTFQSFFRRVKCREEASGRSVGYPRFKGRNRYDSFTYPQLGFSIEGSKLVLSKIGKVRVTLHRPSEGVIKTCQIKREAGRWYACFSVEVEPVPLPTSERAIGLDLGLTEYATPTEGEAIENPRHYRKLEPALRIAQRKVARRKKGSNGRREAVQNLQRIHQHIRNQRQDFLHKQTYLLVMMYGLIVIESLNVKGLASGMLAKSVTDAAWGMFTQILTYKAANAGRELVKVNPNGTSQTCVCGTKVPKTLRDRWHECPNPECKLSMPRDRMSAHVILKLGLGSSLRAPTWSNGTCVAREAPEFIHGV